MDYASECERLNIKILEENMEESLQNPEVGKGSLNGTHTALIMKGGNLMSKTILQLKASVTRTAIGVK